MARKTSIDPGFWMQLMVGLFLVTLGLSGVLQYDSGVSRLGRSLNQMFGGSNNPLGVIIAVVEVVAGAIVVAGLFITIRGKGLYLLTLVIVILWLVQIVYVFVINNLFEPDFLVWLNRLSVDMVMLVALWMVSRKYA